MEFLNDDYLLSNNKAKDIYKKIEDLPIIDPHNHSDLKEIIENKNWQDIWEVEGQTDHYIWQLMRRMGIKENKITGNASNKEKWNAFAEVFPSFALNPVFEWMQLDLKNIFGVEELLDSSNADKIWEITKSKLQKDNYKPRSLLKEMKVEIMCTTDDPVSDLKYHKIAKDEIEDLKIYPTWRPDNYSKIGKETWKEKVLKLIQKYLDSNDLSLTNLLKALELSHSYFDEIGCVSSDHDLPDLISKAVSFKQAKNIFNKKIEQEITEKEIRDFKAFMFNYYAELNRNKDWVMQLHIGVERNYRKSLLDNVGINSGGDIIGSEVNLVDGLSYLLNNFENLTMVAYIINDNYLPPLVTIARAFPNLNLGSSWWFNDSAYGMNKHLDYIAAVDILAKQTGMVTDSRKILSYASRTEVYRRTLANLLGKRVSKKQLPISLAEKIAVDLSYNRPLELFFNNK
ncbi:glucuronate isomerase [Halanaerobium saccharolyticum]|uniref:Uronate isomerase n=1 Tax=Halanaerobium saccharolyticum TaxID=43595 RepID=A0A4R7YXT7_9FIRM|nr:glucuronate isomerase [Halanaerobium saccharolyticum]RAK07164.1 glucuronate isomerase [Halanaerobium saccharolyticum]TDW02077.1 glucuronate isomerase [Halanaerobium saccharolyticum]TDX58808.1 glucuronate isomerase [Halanaerobium saccharolyticum]